MVRRSRASLAAGPPSEEHQLRTLDGEGRAQPEPPRYETATRQFNDGDMTVNYQACDPRDQPARASHWFSWKCQDVLSGTTRMKFFGRSLAAALVAASSIVLVVWASIHLVKAHQAVHYQHEWLSMAFLDQGEVNIQVLKSRSSKNDILRNFCDSNVIDECQIKYFSQGNQADYGIYVQTSSSMVYVNSSSDESQGCLYPITKSIVPKEKCARVFLQHPSDAEYDDPCSEGLSDNFKFSCQLQITDEPNDKSCRCLEAQKLLIQNILEEDYSPFSKDVQGRLGLQGLPEQGFADVQELLDSDMTIIPSTYQVTQVDELDTLFLDGEEYAESQSSSTWMSGFYIITSSLPLDKNSEARGGNIKASTSVEQPESTAHLTKRFALQADHLSETSLQSGEIRKSLNSRALNWVHAEHQRCMKEACGDTQQLNELLKLCSGDLSNEDRLTRDRCAMCSPLDRAMLEEHCKQLVAREQTAVYTVCGMFLALVLAALGLAALRRWRRVKENRRHEKQKISERPSSTISKKPWYRLFRASKARNLSGTDQAETGRSPKKLTKKQPLADGAPVMRGKVPIMPPAHVGEFSLNSIGSNNHRKEVVNTSAALPIIPHIRITSTGSQHGSLDAATRRNSSHGSDGGELLGSSSLHD